MRQFSDLPEMKEQADDSEITRGLEIPTMRCGGCGSKIGSKILGRVLSRLAAGSEQGVLTGLDTPDDAAIIDIPANQKLLQSVDYFRSSLNDPFLFGKIATNHAINDLFAMGAEPHSAMAIASIPYADESKQEEELFHLMSGAVECLQENNTLLVGGHSSESGEMAFGLSVNGFASPAQLFYKSGMQPGDCLILTRALGSGVLFAADMRLKAKARWIEEAVAQMLMSNHDAMLCLRKHGATACTDVSGFGLAGHLFEMIQASAVAVEIDPLRLPLMEGALAIVERGIFSSLQTQNMRVKHAIEDNDNMASLAQYALLFDPQTAGGLLASVPAVRAGACIDVLRSRGYGQAEIIGRVISCFDQTRNMRLTAKIL
jgi:selenide,water dikinase